MTDTKEIIQDCIISPLQRCIDGEILAENYKWYVPENLSRDYRTNPYDEDGFHEAMKPFYWRSSSGRHERAFLCLRGALHGRLPRSCRMGRRTQLHGNHRRTCCPQLWQVSFLSHPGDTLRQWVPFLHEQVPKKRYRRGNREVGGKRQSYTR